MLDDADELGLFDVSDSPVQKLFSLVLLFSLSSDSRILDCSVSSPIPFSFACSEETCAFVRAVDDVIWQEIYIWRRCNTRLQFSTVVDTLSIKEAKMTATRPATELTKIEMLARSKKMFREKL